MLLVKTYIAPSPIHGIGLFAAEPIAKGTTVWRMNPKIDLALTQQEIQELSEFSREQVGKYVFVNRSNGKFVLCGDDARFFNHSPTPSCSDPDDNTTVAARDIQKGEELTSDYHIIQTRL